MAEHWLPRIGLLVRLAAAAVWLVAGAAKALSLTQFHAQVDEYRVLPSAFEAPFAYALPFVELIVGLYLLLGLLTRAVAIVACVLLLLFVIAQAQAWARGLSLDCGCFASLTRDRVGLGTILRDIALGIPSLALAFYPARLFSLDQALLGLPERFGRSTA